MPEHLGDPAHPCANIARSKALIDTIAREARANAERGTADAAEVEAGLQELRADAAQRIGGACGDLCPKYGRCILDSFGSQDPLLQVAHPSPEQQRELGAK